MPQIDTAETEADRRRFLAALYEVRKLLVGHVVKAQHIREAVEIIDNAVMCGVEK